MNYFDQDTIEFFNLLGIYEIKGMTWRHFIAVTCDLILLVIISSHYNEFTNYRRQLIDDYVEVENVDNMSDSLFNDDELDEEEQRH